MLEAYSHLALPLPSGVSPNDLDASVKFEFPFPSVVRLLHGAERVCGGLPVFVLCFDAFICVCVCV